MDEIWALLDRHLEVLTRLGAPASAYLSGGLDPSVVRRRLEDQGLSARDDVVAYFSWRTPAREMAVLFREWMFLPSIEESIDLRQRGIRASKRIGERFSKRLPYEHFVEEPPPWDARDLANEPAIFPGPTCLLPVAYLDSIDFVAIDPRSGADGGKVYLCSLGNGGVFSLCESLAEMLRTATALLELGMWRIEYEGDRYFILDGTE